MILRIRLAAAVAAAAFASLGFGQALSLPFVPSENPLTPEKAILGKILFWDVQLSSDGGTSCGSCHLPRFGGNDPRVGLHPGHDGVFGGPDDVVGSPGVHRAKAGGAFDPDPAFGHGAQVTPRAANTVIGAAYPTKLFWDGRASPIFVDPQNGQVAVALHGALESQAIGPLQNDVEMSFPGRTWADIAARLASVRPLAAATDLPPDVAARLADGPTYPELFADAFGTETITARRIAFALASYERTLAPNQTPYDLYEQGQTDALTPDQVAGMDVFFSNTTRCFFCHQPPAFSNFVFRNIGLRPIEEDVGRFAITGQEIDRGRFKIPSLRNVALKTTLMHNGRFTTLDEVIDFYTATNGQVQYPENQDPIVPGIVVTPEERPLLIDFLVHGLTDPRVAAGAFPFDRPTLHTELPPNPELIPDGAVPGTGDLVPAMIAVDPPLLGNDVFRFGIDGALGGATATLTLHRVSADDGAPIATFGPIVLEGDGPGAGHGTIFWPIPDDPALLGDEIHARWSVDDPAAADGVARSAEARVRFYRTDPTSCGCPADLDCDHAVDFTDLVDLLGRWGACDLCGADITDDGTVDFADLLQLLSVYGDCG